MDYLSQKLPLILSNSCNLLKDSIPPSIIIIFISGLHPSLWVTSMKLIC